MKASKRFLKKALSVAVSAAMLLNSSAMAFAENEQASVENITAITLSEPEWEYHEGVGSIYNVGEPISFWGMRPGTFNTSYYNQLDADSQAVYDALLSSYSAGAHDNTVSVSVTTETFEGIIMNATTTNTETGTNTNLSLEPSSTEIIYDWAETEIVPALLALLYDHPELSWLVNVSFGTRYSGFAFDQADITNGNGANTITATVSGVEFWLTTVKTDTGNASDLSGAIATAKAAINAAIGNSTDRYDIVKGINDYLCNTVTYNHDAVTDGIYTDDQLRCYQTAYSAFFKCNGDDEITTVCAGYAKGFKVLCDSYGIPCVYVSGEAGTSSMGPHGWNYVQMDNGNWYAVDATWADQEGGTGIIDDFFLVGSSTPAPHFSNLTFSDTHVSSGVLDDNYTYTFTYPTLSTTAYEPGAEPEKTALTEENVTVTDGLTYNGSAQSPTITVKVGETTLVKDTDYTISGTASATDADTYTVTVTGKGNYEGTVEKTWTIGKADSYVTASPASTSPVYNGTAQALVVAGTPNGGTLEYSLNETDWSAEIPTGTNVGSYTVYARVKGDENHNDSVVVSVPVTIAKRPITITIESKTIETTENVPALGHSITEGSLAAGHSLSLNCEFELSEYAPGEGMPGNFTYAPSAGYPKITDSSDNDVTANYDISVIKGVLSIVEHVHEWQYRISEDLENTIVAVCRNSLTCNVVTPPTITLNAPSNLGFDYNSKSATLTINDDLGAFDGIDDSDITYCDANESPLLIAPADAGTYTADIWVDGAYARVTFTITPKDLNDITAPVPSVLYYEGDEQSIVFSFPDSDCPYGDFYLTAGTEYTMTGTTSATDAGTYNVTMTGKGNYTGTINTSWTINKAEIDSIEAFLDENGDEIEITKEFDGTNTYETSAIKQIKVKSQVGTPMTLTVGEGYNLAITLDGTDTGETTCTAVITISGDMADNYINASYSFDNIPAEITKTKATVTTAPEAVAGLVYNGSAQELINEGTAEGGTMMYSIDDGATWSENIPSKTDADSYIVKYYAKADENHSDSAVSSVEVTVAPFDLTNAVADGTTEFEFNGSAYNVGDYVKLYLDAEKTREIPCTVSGDSSATNTGSHAAVYTTSDDNFTGSKTVNWEITPTDITGFEKFCDADTNQISVTKEFDGTTDFDTSALKLAEVTLGTEPFTLEVGTDADVTVTFADSAVGTTNYTVVIAPKGDAANNFKESSYSFTMTDGEITRVKAKLLTAPEAVTGLVYDGNAQELVTAGTAEGGTMQYGMNDGNSWTWTDTVPKATDAGTYTVYYKVIGDANHENGDYDETTDFVTVTIAEATPQYTAPEAKTDLIYNAEEQALITAGESSDGTFWYSTDGSTFAETLPVGYDADEYTVYWKLVGNDNYADVSVQSFKVTIAKKDVTVTAEDKSMTYGETEPALTYTYDNLAGTDTLIGALVREAGTDAGTYAITQGTLTNENNPNYNITFVDGTFTINKATPDTSTIPEPVASEITYGQALSASTLPNGWKWSEPTCIPAVGEECEAYYTVDDTNYDYSGVSGYDADLHAITATAVITINKADVTVKAEDKYIIVGAELPEATYTVTGLVNGDTLTVNPTIGYSGADNMTIGEYDIIVSGAEASNNYTITHKNGKLYVGICDHDGTMVRKYDADSHWFDCTKCKATGLSDEAHSGGTATCTTKAECSACGQEYGTVDSNNHNVSTTWAYDTDGHWHGCECGTKFDSAAHSGGTATCTKQAVCTVCKIPYGKALGHSWKTEWANNSTHHWHECQNADCPVTADSNKDSYAAHSFGEWVTVTEATATTKGLAKRTCECGYEETKDIPATGGSGGSSGVPAVTTPSFIVTTSNWSPIPSVTTTPPSVTGTTPGWSPNPSVTTTTTATTTTLPPVSEEDEVIDDDIYEDDDAEPQIKGDNGKMGWDAISDEIADAEDGDVITVDMNGATELPEEILEQIQGKDIDLVIELDNGATWTINGESITDPADIDLGVEFDSDIPVKVINNVTDECDYITISLAHDGEFGFTAVLTIDMGDENEGLYANLYYYTGNDTEFITADKIDSKGKADLTFTHASEYVIVIDEDNHGKRVEESDDEEIVTEDEDNDSNPFTAVTISFTGVIVSAAAVAITRKRRK